VTDVRSMGYAAIVIAVLDGELTSDEADAEFKRRAGRRASTRAVTFLSASAQDDDELSAGDRQTPQQTESKEESPMPTDNRQLKLLSTFPDLGAPGSSYVATHGTLTAMIMHWASDPGYAWVAVLDDHDFDGRNSSLVETKKPVRVDGVPCVLDAMGFKEWNSVRWHASEAAPVTTPPWADV
jgi:hypothetical protein